MGQYSNIGKMVTSSLVSWRKANEYGLTGIRTIDYKGNKLITDDGHEFINMCSCSYLGLNRHPKIIDGAIRALEHEGTMSTSVSRARIAPRLMVETEQLMSKVFDAEIILTTSCFTASVSVLPLLASGQLTEGKKPLMIFDRSCHFSMNILKPNCGNETEVVTCPHNSIEFIEQACKENDTVAYVCDGAYSMGGNAPIEELIRLQKEYGLFLYIDDSHSISVYGEQGVGLSRSFFDKLNDRTVIVGSLAKAFGATGGVIMLGSNKYREMLDYCSGPLGWSQMINAPGLGAIKASAQIHLSDELPKLQAQLGEAMAHFDRIIPSSNAGNGLPIRVIDLPSVDDAVEASARLFQKGFYCSAVFFPIVAKDRPGIRVMGRANMSNEDIESFCEALKTI
ncbi:aminotransferase class I/II-fold pyridoxal phosphate-dependent enzyme [Xenorhabdus sp. KK7.4]|uniref:aminotransferase class I/II-fold pyridoxal phosphate-dependent enzyme n=1 Tax=Xenorhabdus sp. KK7.4 TaxID=1851572 RepID=UPI000C039C05|nr:aminotransferase class I/II-fold pyridoxal phosphate-dependent enzyme [Xenorhabdus sp. KK7.4]PHM51218.1 8-amino-7-oxononanoate synthase [Xenorhabdus sp. KK7.4]